METKKAQSIDLTTGKPVTEITETENKDNVNLKTNAKGDVQIEVSCYRNTVEEAAKDAAAVLDNLRRKYAN